MMACDCLREAERIINEALKRCGPTQTERMDALHDARTHVWRALDALRDARTHVWRALDAIPENL